MREPGVCKEQCGRVLGNGRISILEDRKAKGFTLADAP